MYTRSHKVLTLIMAHVITLLVTSCSEFPEYYGPLCDDAETHDWSPAASRPELDHVDYAAWTENPALEQLLRTYGRMDDSWGFLAGDDVNEDGIVVSPYGKTLNAYELIVATPGLERWAQTLVQGYPVHGSCGERAANEVAATLSGKSGHRIDLFQIFYERNVVSRASFLIHEAGHAAGVSGHIDNKDRSWDAGGAYRLQAEFLAALYHAQGVSEGHRAAALKEFDWILRAKFVEPVHLTIEDLRPEAR